jgi:hypothetical protein
MLQEHKSGYDIAIVRGRCVGNRTLFLQPPSHAIERLIREVIRSRTILSVEVCDQPPPNLQVPLAVRIEAPIEPLEQLLKGFWRR